MSALDEYGELLTEWVADIEAKREARDYSAVIEHFVSTAERSPAVGEPVGPDPMRMFVRGVMQYLDRDDR